MRVTFDIVRSEVPILTAMLAAGIATAPEDLVRRAESIVERLAAAVEEAMDEEAEKKRMEDQDVRLADVNLEDD